MKTFSKQIVRSLFLKILVLTIAAAGVFGVFGQEQPLNLGQILSELQSKSTVITIAQKNEAITKSVQARGVTFTLNAEIEKELRTAGASDGLISAIRSKSPGSDEKEPDAVLNELRVVPARKNGVSGINLVADFNVYGLKDTSSDIVYRFQKDGKFISGTNSEYRTQSGDLSARRLLKPTADSTVYKDLDAFIPYKEFGLAPGTYDLKIDVDVILRDGKLVKHLTLQDSKITIPANDLPAPSAKFEKLWIDYNVNQDGQLGMVVHVTATISGLKDEEAYLQLLFEKENGTKLTASATQYRSPTGQTAGYMSLKPIYDSARFNDIKIFIPYSEFNLPVGEHKLRIHADVVYPDYTDLGHLTYYNFQYTKSR